MAVEDSHHKLLDAFAAAWRCGDVDALMRMMTPDCTFRSSIGPEPGQTFVGHQTVRRAFQMYVPTSDTPGVDTEMEAALVGPHFAVTRWTTGRRKADGTIQPDVIACDILEFEGDQIKRKDTFRKLYVPPVED